MWMYLQRLVQGVQITHAIKMLCYLERLFYSVIIVSAVLLLLTVGMIKISLILERWKVQADVVTSAARLL